MKDAQNTGKIENEAMFSISYGLYALTARDENSDNGCIINTVMQVTDSPKRIAIAINKGNYTHDMITRTGVFNVSVLTVETPFSFIERFGFHSGRNSDKFSGYSSIVRAANSLAYFPECSNSVISASVIDSSDLGTHTLFISEVRNAVVLSEKHSATYEYYLSEIKPKSDVSGKKRFVCKICGYVYEGATLPEDFICPVCKHPAADFEPA